MADVIRPDDRADDEALRADLAEIERNAALNAAAGAHVERDLAEAEAIDARIAASQNARAASELSTHNRIINNELAAERVAASNNAFGFYLAVGILFAVILVGALYWWYWRPQDSSNINVYAAPNPPSSTLVTPQQQQNRVYVPVPVPVPQNPAPSQPSQPAQPSQPSTPETPNNPPSSGGETSPPPSSGGQ